MGAIVFSVGGTSRFYPSLAVVLAMLAVAAAGYLWLPRAEVALPPVAGCRLDRETCAAILPDGGTIEVSLDPKPVPKAGPMRVSLVVQGLKANQADVHFQGVNMNMGRHRLTLAAAGEGRFAGETTLPVCVTGSMLWQATVQLEAERKSISVPFRFESGG